VREDEVYGVLDLVEIGSGQKLVQREVLHQYVVLVH
jgi:hypothetical protein